MMRWLALNVFLGVLCAVFWLSPVLAQSNDAAQPATPVIDKSKLMVQPRGAKAGSGISFRDDPVRWIQEQQRSSYAAMSSALRSMRGGSSHAMWSLLLVSFGYGVLHAAGPGHGKAVISAWLLATENQLRRGILVALWSSIVQALTAIAIVSVVLLLARSASLAAKSAAQVMESISFALIALMGAYLAFTGVRLLSARFANAPPIVAAAAPHHFEIVNPLPHHVQHNHRHGPDCGCDHAHFPSAQDVKGDWSLGKAASLSVGVGIRPCTGALLVLIAAHAMGLYGAGIAAVFAMAAGTFLTVSVIAAAAVYGNRAVMHLAARDQRWFGLANAGLRLAAGLAIVALGGVLFLGSLDSSSSLM
jgi:nickel/cobalt transporter (NicO) family protein